MRNRLLITAAFAALLVGTSIAAAQERKEGTMSVPGAQQNAPAEKIGPPLKRSTTGSGGADVKSGQTPEQKSQSAPEHGAPTHAQRPGEMKPGGKSETTGQGADKSPGVPSAAPSKSNPEPKKSGNKSETTGQAPGASQAPGPSPSPSPGAVQRSPAPNAPQAGPGGQSGAGATPNTQSQSTRQGASVDSSTNVSVSFTPEQRMRIRRTVILARNAPRVRRVDFALNVGTVVPRERVYLVVVPETLVEIHPAWRGFLYFLVRDEIIVVEPGSHRIVAILDV